MGICGRYTHLLTWSQIVELYRLTLPDEPKELTPSYNVAPTHVVRYNKPELLDRVALILQRVIGGRAHWRGSSIRRDQSRSSK